MDSAESHRNAIVECAGKGSSTVVGYRLDYCLEPKKQLRDSNLWN